MKIPGPILPPTINSIPDMFSTEERLQNVIDRLTEAVLVVSQAEHSDAGDYTKTYAYCNGYGRSALMGATQDLQNILSDIKEDKIDCLFGSDYEKDIQY